MQKPHRKSNGPGSRIRWLLSTANRRSPSLLPILSLGVASSLLFGLGLGALDLWAPDEPRYGAIAEELRAFGHGPAGLVLLHLNDQPYTQKPPLYFWLAAAAGAPAGRVDEAAARLPSALAGVACVVLTAWIGRMLFRNPAVAWLAAGLLATTARFAFSARRVQLDVLLTAFELTAIALFLVLEMRRGGVEQADRHPWLVAGLHAALGAAALVKGPVGWLPLLIFAAYLAWEGRSGAFRRIVPSWALLLSIGPVALWIGAAVLLAPQGFAQDAVSENLFGRFFSGTSHARPFYYYLYQLPLDALPWSLLLPFAAPVLWHTAFRQGRIADGPRWAASPFRFLSAWLLLPLAFFTLSAGKRGLYLLPIYPALALTFALALDSAAWRARWPRLDLGRAIGVVLVVGGLELALFTVGLSWLDAEKSPRPIAEATAAHARPGESVGVYGLGPIEGGLAYYGPNRVESLRDEAQLRAYLGRGGRLVLLRARHLETLADELGLMELQSFRSGRRRLALASASPD